MQNKIGQLAEDALIEANYAGNYPRQMPIFLLVDKETREITVETRNYQIGGTPARQWNGFVSAYQLPANVDADRLAADIDEHYSSQFEALCDGWDSVWDGQNWKGTLTDDAVEIEMLISQDIESGAGLSELDEEAYTDYLIAAGIIDADGN
jgi:hypothetical protein